MSNESEKERDSFTKAEAPEKSEFLTASDAPKESEDRALSEYTPGCRTDALRLWVYKNETASEIFKILSHTVVAFTVYALFYRLMLMLEAGELPGALKLSLALGAPFVLVSILRRVINAPRPYELLPFYERQPKKRSGRAFPSRHVFSVFAIAVALIPAQPLIGASLLLCGVLMAFVRVALGMHFVRDVLAGGAIGIVSGILAILVA